LDFDRLQQFLRIGLGFENARAPTEPGMPLVNLMLEIAATRAYIGQESLA